VAVRDSTDAGLQQRGKQTLKPGGIWYTAVSGIWQAVWLEPVPEVYIERIKLNPDVDNKILRVESCLQGSMEGLDLEVEISAEGKESSTFRGRPDRPLECNMAYPRLWSPEDPFLYDLRVRLVSGKRAVDEVSGYAAMRKFSLIKDSAGYSRFALNNRPLYIYGPLDQGYYPDGLYTPPSEEAMLFDIEYTRNIGCNMIRKHVKVEPERWYYHCDRLGMIVWQDMPNGGKPMAGLRALLPMLLGLHRDDTRRPARFGRGHADNREEFRTELQGMIDHLYNAPCIAVWAPFNENWGQFNARDTVDWIKKHDSTRPVDHASGWFDQGAGDFRSRHIYFVKPRAGRSDHRCFAITEFGGYSMALTGHLWKREKKFGYRFYVSPEELTHAYVSLLRDCIIPLISRGLAAAVYTQTTDVETEINGFLTYDRRAEKMDANILREIHEELYRERGKVCTREP